MKTYTFKVTGKDVYDDKFARITVDVKYPGTDMIQTLGRENINRVIQEKLDRLYPGYKLEEWRFLEVK